MARFRTTLTDDFDGSVDGEIRISMTVDANDEAAAARKMAGLMEKPLDWTIDTDHVEAKRIREKRTRGN